MSSNPRTPMALEGRRMRDDRGVALVEATFVAPVLLLFIMGMLEYGLVFRDYLTVSDAAANGARVGSIQGPNPTTTGDSADESIIASMRQDLANIPYTSIDRIVIFRGGPAASGTPLDQVPAACKTGSVPRGDTANKCNIYSTYASFIAVQNDNSAYFKCSGANTVACGWNPTTRVDGPKVANIEYLGVYVKLNRPMLTGFFGKTFNLEVASVIRLEPGQLN